VIIVVPSPYSLTHSLAVIRYVTQPSKDRSKLPVCADIAKLTTLAGNVYVSPSATCTAHKFNTLTSYVAQLPFNGFVVVTTVQVLSVK
jgi:hypothetical protein